MHGAVAQRQGERHAGLRSADLDGKRRGPAAIGRAQRDAVEPQRIDLDLPGLRLVGRLGRRGHLGRLVGGCPPFAGRGLASRGGDQLRQIERAVRLDRQRRPAVLQRDLRQRDLALAQVEFALFDADRLERQGRRLVACGAHRQARDAGGQCVELQHGRVALGGESVLARCLQRAGRLFDAQPVAHELPRGGELQAGQLDLALAGHRLQRQRALGRQRAALGQPGRDPIGALPAFDGGQPGGFGLDGRHRGAGARGVAQVGHRGAGAGQRRMLHHHRRRRGVLGRVGRRRAQPLGQLQQVDLPVGADPRVQLGAFEAHVGQRPGAREQPRPFQVGEQPVGRHDRLGRRQAEPHVARLQRQQERVEAHLADRGRHVEPVLRQPRHVALDQIGHQHEAGQRMKADRHRHGGQRDGGGSAPRAALASGWLSRTGVQPVGRIRAHAGPRARVGRGRSGRGRRTGSG